MLLLLTVIKGDFDLKLESRVCDYSLDGVRFHPVLYLYIMLTALHGGLQSPRACATELTISGVMAAMGDDRRKLLIAVIW